MHQRAVLAGGCFWGMQDLIRKLPGVVATRVGYTGGDTPNATYRNHGSHAEGIEIIFDTAETSFRRILEHFFQIHDPTTRDRQGNDTGTSYRSAIFFTSDEQRKVAEETIADVNASGLWPGKVVTEVTPVGDFWEAEPEHQDYLERYPSGYTCHFPRSNWVLPKRDAVSKSTATPAHAGVDAGSQKETYLPRSTTALPQSGSWDRDRQDGAKLTGNCNGHRSAWRHGGVRNVP